jgi:Cyclic nucleotide-binding domain
MRSSCASAAGLTRPTSGFTIKPSIPIRVALEICREMFVPRWRGWPSLAMQYNDVKKIVTECVALSGLDEATQAFLLRHGDETSLDAGEMVYAEGTNLDDSFCVLLSGSLTIERGGRVVAETSKNEVIGEMAYFSPQHKRSATVRAASEKVSILKVQLPPENLASPLFAPLKKCLALQTWHRPID